MDEGDWVMYEYKATLKRVVDGDTVWLRVDLGFRIWSETDFRLLGIDAPERVGVNANPLMAAASMSYLESLIVGKELTIQTYKPDKYGRWLVKIYLPDGTDVNAAMVGAGHAVVYP
jgi:micrococcal nuclease